MKICEVEFSKAWKSYPKMLEEREEFAAVVVGQSSIIALGGHRTHQEQLRSVEMLTLHGNRQDVRWTRLPKMKQARVGSAAVAVGMRVFVFGGFNRQRGALNSAEMLILQGKEIEWQS